MAWDMTRTRPLFVVGSLVVACSATVERMPACGESVRATAFLMEAGGKGLNVAVAAHRLGQPVDGLFAVGADGLGAFARAAFAGTGLSPDMLVPVEGATGAGVGFIEPGGDNRIAVCPAANDRLAADHAAGAAGRIAGAALVLAQFEVTDAPIVAAFAEARGAGVPTLLNPSPYRALLPAILAATDILVVNEGEARALALDMGIDLAAGSFGKEALAQLAERLSVEGIDTLIVTLGARGVLGWHAGAVSFQPAWAVEAVDAIGAGDAFTGGLAVALAEGRGLDEALRWGAGAGAMVAARLGLLEALPTRAELAAFLGGGA